MFLKLYITCVIFTCVKSFLLDDRTTVIPSPDALSTHELLRILDEERYLRNQLESAVTGLTSRLTGLEKAVTGLYHQIQHNISTLAFQTDRLLELQLNGTITSLKTDISNFSSSILQVSQYMEFRLKNIENKLNETEIHAENMTKRQEHKLILIEDELNKTDILVANLSAITNRQEQAIDDLKNKLYVNGLRIQNISLSEQNLSLIVKDLERPTVAFSAEGIDIGNATLLTNQTIVFTNLILNIGDAYDSSTGIFTAPINGLYMFSVQMCAQHSPRSNKRFVFKVFAGPKVIQSILNGRYDFYHTYDSRVANNAGTVTQPLVAGEKVWVQNAGSQYVGLSGYSNDCWNHFGGVLIH